VVCITFEDGLTDVCRHDEHVEWRGPFSALRRVVSRSSSLPNIFHWPSLLCGFHEARSVIPWMMKPWTRQLFPRMFQTDEAESCFVYPR